MGIRHPRWEDQDWLLQEVMGDVNYTVPEIKDRTRVPTVRESQSPSGRSFPF